MGQMIVSEREMQVIDAVRADLARQGWTAGDTVRGGPLSANFMLQAILHGKRFGLLAADAPVILEDPKYTTPWDVRGVRIDEGRLVLDVWG